MPLATRMKNMVDSRGCALLALSGRRMYTRPARKWSSSEAWEADVRV